MNRNRLAIAAVLTWALSAAPLFAAKLGDPAPELKVASWAKGKPVKLSEGKGKKVYVIEFWATWCPPCRASIPHLTELQKKFNSKNVVFVGVSDELLDEVKPFVKEQGEKMDYNVAVDKDQATSRAYLGAFGVDSIPHAFIATRKARSCGTVTRWTKSSSPRSRSWRRSS